MGGLTSLTVIIISLNFFLKGSVEVGEGGGFGWGGVEGWGEKAHNCG